MMVATLWGQLLQIFLLVTAIVVLMMTSTRNAKHLARLQGINSQAELAARTAQTAQILAAVEAQGDELTRLVTGLAASVDRAGSPPVTGGKG